MTLLTQEQKSSMLLSQSKLHKEELAGGSQKNKESVSVNRKRFGGMLNEAQTIMSRDYKGLGSGRDTMNGVLESERNNHNWTDGQLRRDS